MAGKKGKERRRRYSDEDRANAIAALAANGGNVNLTAKQLDIPATTLKHWADGTRHAESAQLGEQKKGPLADRLELVAWKLAESLDGKIEAAGLQQTATSLGIVIDKMQLLRNKPTEIQGHTPDEDLRNLSDEELDRRLAEARSRASATGRGDPTAAGK